MKKDFTKDDTIAIKGIAVVLMLIHHLWGFNDRIHGGGLDSLFGDKFLYAAGLFGKICVSLFFFLGGYGIYISSKKRNFSLLNKIKRLYISYWKVFLIFIPIGFIFFSNTIPYCENSAIYLRFSSVNFKSILSDFLGITNILNGEWWFFKSYILALITFPMIKKIFNKYDIKTNIFIIIIFSILSTNVLPAIGNIKELGNLNSNYLYYNLFCQGAPFISCFWVGVLFGKENLLIKIKEALNKEIKLNIFIDVTLLVLIFYLRECCIIDNLDIIYVPLLVIVASDLLNKIDIIKKLFYKIGKESTNIWLTHSFYCYYFYPIVKIVMAPRYALLCLIVLILISYMGSILLEYIWKHIIKSYDFIKIKFINVLNLIK